LSGQKTDKGIRLFGTKNGRQVVDTTEKENTLSDAIGKSMGDKILASKEQSGSFKGDEITISDTGMAGFYDKIIPSFANKYTKKWGGRVGETKLGIQDYSAAEDFPFQVYEIATSPEQIIESFATKKEADNWINNEQGYGEPSEFAVLDKSGKEAQVHSLEITDPMRESVMQGQPAFQLRGKPVPKERGFVTVSKLLCLI